MTRLTSVEADGKSLCDCRLVTGCCDTLSLQHQCEHFTGSRSVKNKKGANPPWYELGQRLLLKMQLIKWRKEFGLILYSYQRSNSVLLRLHDSCLLKRQYDGPGRLLDKSKCCSVTQNTSSSSHLLAFISKLKVLLEKLHPLNDAPLFKITNKMTNINENLNSYKVKLNPPRSGSVKHRRFGPSMLVFWKQNSSVFMYHRRHHMNMIKRSFQVISLKVNFKGVSNMTEGAGPELSMWCHREASLPTGKGGNQLVLLLFKAAKLVNGSANISCTANQTAATASHGTLTSGELCKRRRPGFPLLKLASVRLQELVPGGSFYPVHVPTEDRQLNLLQTLIRRTVGTFSEVDESTFGAFVCVKTQHLLRDSVLGFLIFF